MEDYYILANDNDPTTTGDVYPQIEKHENWCYENFQMLSSLRFDELPKENFVLDYLVLHKKAKLTDFVTDGTLSRGFIISKNVKDILCSCSLPLHKFFDTNIEVANNKVTNYFWFFPVINMFPLIDFNSSKFRISKRFLPNEIVMQDVVFNDISDIKNFESKNSMLKVHGQAICFTEKIQYDIFTVGSFSFDWIITAKLKTLLDEHNISGFVTKQIDWIK